jgi:hypothetical protein
MLFDEHQVHGVGEAGACAVLEVRTEASRQSVYRKKVVRGYHLLQDAIDEFQARLDKRWELVGFFNIGAVAESLVVKYRLPGLVILWMVGGRGGIYSGVGGVAGREIPRPPPLPSTFPPTALDEHDPKLLALCERVRYEPPAARLCTLSRSLGWAVFCLMVLLFMQPALHAGWRLPYVALVGALALAACAYASHWPRRRWLIVPGGVVMKRFVLGRLGFVGARYSVSDTVLVVRSTGALIPRWLSRYEARLYRGRKRAGACWLTDCECAALLAAWQSPARDPSGLRSEEKGSEAI